MLPCVFVEEPWTSTPNCCFRKLYTLWWLNQPVNWSCWYLFCTFTSVTWIECWRVVSSVLGDALLMDDWLIDDLFHWECPDVCYWGYRLLLYMTPKETNKLRPLSVKISFHGVLSACQAAVRAAMFPPAGHIHTLQTVIPSITSVLPPPIRLLLLCPFSHRGRYPTSS